MHLKFDFSLDLLTASSAENDPTLFIALDTGNQELGPSDAYHTEPLDLFASVEEALEMSVVDGKFATPEDKEAFVGVAWYLEALSRYAWFLVNTTGSKF